MWKVRGTTVRAVNCYLIMPWVGVFACLASAFARSADMEVVPTPPSLPLLAEPVAGHEVTDARRPGEAMTALSAASCATASCHGGPEAGNRDVQSFAATLWAKRDPHARAFETLHDPRSKRMAALLGIGEAHRAKTCLACHSVQAQREEPLPAAVLCDGVACSSCHGDATEWLAIHHLPEWNHMTPEAQASTGFRELSDVTSRVQTCIPCHVGDASREVDHDMIAAGHPRLAFEFAAFQRLAPRHWSPRGKAESKPDFAERSWAVGQAETLAAVAKLLEQRAYRTREAIDLDHARDGTKTVRWPEFAEFDCYSCHRPLSPEQVEARGLGAHDNPFPGAASWQPWSVAAARLLAAAVDDPTTAAVGRSAADLRAVFEPDWAACNRRRVEQVITRAQALTRTAHSASRALAAMQNVSLDASPRRLDAVDRPDSRFWDSAAQTYLLMEAAMDGGSAPVGTWVTPSRSEPVSATREALDGLRASLRFPPGSGGPDRFDPLTFERDRLAVPQRPSTR